MSIVSLDAPASPTSSAPSRNGIRKISMIDFKTDGSRHVVTTKESGVPPRKRSRPGERGGPAAKASTKGKSMKPRSQILSSKPQDPEKHKRRQNDMCSVFSVKNAAETENMPPPRRSSSHQDHDTNAWQADTAREAEQDVRTPGPDRFASSVDLELADLLPST